MKISDVILATSVFALACAQAAGQGDPFSQAEAMLAASRYNEALAASERALALDPEDGRGFLLKGRALFGLFKFEPAAAAFQEAMLRLPFDTPISIEAHEGFTESLFAGARVEEGRTDLGKALDMLETALVMDSHNAHLLAARARILDRLGRRDEALEACDKAIRADPACAEALSLAASINLRHGRKDEAKSHLEALFARPSDASSETLSWARLNLGLLAIEAGDRRAALNHFTCAAELDPGNERAREAAAEIAAFREQARKAAAAERTLIVGCATAIAAWAALVAVLRIRYF